jgi:hypothetical protein
MCVLLSDFFRHQQATGDDNVMATTVLRKYNNQWRVCIHHASVIATSVFTQNAKEYPDVTASTLPMKPLISKNSKPPSTSIALSGNSKHTDISTTGIPGMVIAPRKSGTHTPAQIQASLVVPKSHMTEASSAAADGVDGEANEHPSKDEKAVASKGSATTAQSNEEKIEKTGDGVISAFPQGKPHTRTEQDDILAMLRQITGKIFPDSHNHSHKSKPTSKKSPPSADKNDIIKEQAPTSVQSQPFVKPDTVAKDSGHSIQQIATTSGKANSMSPKRRYSTTYLDFYRFLGDKTLQALNHLRSQDRYGT